MKKSITVQITLAILILTSCGKNYSRYPGPAEPVIDLGNVTNTFSDLKPTGQTFTGEAGTAFQVSGSGGTKLNFYPNSFKDEKGNIITSGKVTFNLTEMYGVGDMIANRAATMCKGALLQSGGQINLSATMNGKEVFANKFGIKFRQNGASLLDMALFYGSTKNPTNTTTWAISDTSGYGQKSWATTNVDGVDYYEFDSCTNFNWVNCDRFFQNGGRLTSVSAILPDATFNPGNTQLYVVLPGTKSALTSGEDALGGSFWDEKSRAMYITSEDRINIVPKDVNYKLVAIARKIDKYYYFESAGKITDSVRQNVVFAPKTKEEISALLRAL